MINVVLRCLFVAGILSTLIMKHAIINLSYYLRVKRKMRLFGSLIVELMLGKRLDLLFKRVEVSLTS